jgi:hypothetical protein
MYSESYGDETAVVRIPTATRINHYGPGCHARGDAFELVTPRGPSQTGNSPNGNEPLLPRFRYSRKRCMTIQARLLASVVPLS